MKVELKATGYRRLGFVEYRVCYGGQLPDGVLWLPAAMPPEVLEDVIRDMLVPA